MLIKSVDIQGFKSFADRTSLRFSKGLTAVVGPNGSGKSNISDAVRWVLGEQSTKQLRGQSMEDVIFSGTEHRKGHGYCEVTINFDNTDRALAFDNDSVAVTRRYYRSHDSEYLINGNFVRLKDVHELFMDTGLGRDGYSMIGQGKIDTIVSSKSEERRDIFEEAAGISRYRYRKEESERKLNLAEDNLVRLRDIEGELKSRIDPLKKQSEAASEFLCLSDEKKELEIGVWLNMLESSKEKFKNHENKIALAKSQYALLEQKFEESENEIDKNAAYFASLTAEIDDLRKNAGGTDQKVATLIGDKTVLNTEINFNNENIVRLESEKEAILNEKSDSGNTIVERENERNALEEKKVNLDKKIETLTAELSQLMLDNALSIKSREELNFRLNEIAIKLSENRATIAANQSNVENLKTTIKGLIEQITGLNAEIASYDEEIKTLNKELTRCEEDILSYENSRKGYVLKKESRLSAVNKLTDELNGAVRERDDFVRRAEMLKELDKNMDGFSYAVKAVTAASEEKRLSGVFGAAGKLIEVDSKYATAIEIALGSAAGNIIVRNDGDAKRAIRYLKDNKLGRATFLPIDSLKATAFNEKGVKNEEGFIGMADSLIKVDNQYKSVFAWLLGHTVICEDLDSAANISKKYKYHFKTVSLDGQVVNPGGSLTGGSVSRTAGTLSRKYDIERLNNKADEKQTQIKELEQKLSAAQTALSEINADILNTESVMITANEDKIRLLMEIKRVTELKDSLNLQKSEKESEMENQKSIKSLLEEQSKNSEDLIVKLSAEENTLKNSSTQEPEEISKKRETLSAELYDTRLVLGDTAKDIEVLNKIISDLNLSAGEKDEKIKAIDRQIENLRSKNDDLALRINALDENIEATKKEGIDLSGKGEQLVLERNEIESKNKELREAQKQINTDKENLSGEIARLNERKEIMLNELESIVAKLYDEYELTRTEAEALNIHIENITEAKKRLSEIRAKIKALGTVNLSAIEEYKEVKERYDFLSGQIADVEKSKAELIKLISELNSRMETMFTEGFKRISNNFSKVFREMFGGGEGSLKLTDPENVLSSGIEIIAKLPGKNVPSLEGLSGGEKALIAISIYFAIMEVNAPPFCFLDEVETALDEINVDRFARYIKNSTLPTQFICITHRRGTMECADMLYGVTMQEKGVTKLIELDVEKLEKQLKTLKVEK